MVRVLLVLALVSGIARDAAAGQKCRQRPAPEIVFWNDAGDVHSNGMWHRTRPRGEEAGFLSPAARVRFKAYVDSGAKPARVIRCLDALIANPDGRRARRACRVRART